MKTSLLFRVLLISFCVLLPMQTLSAKESLPLSDEEFSQEVKKFIVKPCMKRIYQYSKKNNPSNLAADFTLDDFLRLEEMRGKFHAKEFQQALEKDLLNNKYGNVKNTSKDNRNLIYKMAKLGCERVIQERERDEGLSKTNRQTLRQDSLKSDSVLNDSSDSDSAPTRINVLADLDVAPLTDERRKQLNVPEDVAGVVVDEVKPGSAAESAGLQQGDIILEVNREVVKGLDDYQRVVPMIKKGELVVLFLSRRGNNLFVAVNPSEITSKMKNNSLQNTEQNTEKQKKHAKRERDEEPFETSRQTQQDDSSDSDSVPTHIKKKAMEHCKQQYQLLDSFTGGGFGSSWSMLNACVKMEINAYQEFQRNYGD